MIYLGMVGVWQTILIFVIIAILLTILALIDILRNQFIGNNKIIRGLIVLFGGFFGAVLYFPNRQRKEDFIVIFAT